MAGDFQQRRGRDWNRLSALLDRARSGRLRGMSHSELVELRVLYRRVAGDLAYVQSQLGDARLEAYLNDLVARGHSLLYTPPPRSFSQGLAELYYAGAETLRRRLVYVGLALAVTVLGAVAAGVLVSLDPTWTSVFIPPEFQESLAAWKTGKFEDPPGEMAFAFAAQLNLNNSLVALMAFGSGVLFGVPVALMLFNNGLVLGAFSVELARDGLLTHFVTGVAPHGVPELSAIFFAGGGGLLLAHAVIAPGERSRAEVLREKGADGFWLVAVSLVLLLYAALVEAYVSHSQLPAPVKLALAALALGLLAAYVFGVRRPSRPVPAAGTRF